MLRKTHDLFREDIKYMFVRTHKLCERLSENEAALRDLTASGLLLGGEGCGDQASVYSVKLYNRLNGRLSEWQRDVFRECVCVCVCKCVVHEM